MVTIVFFFELQHHCFKIKPVFFCHRFNFGVQIFTDFFFGNTADSCIAVVHADDFEIVEFAEDAEL